MKHKIVHNTNIHKITPAWHGKRAVLVGGCFDILHFGHLTFLQKAKDHGDMLIIALESDEFIRKNKNREPIHSQDQRAQILAALHFVDYVITLPLFDNPKEYGTLVQLVSPSVIAITEGDPHLEDKKRQAQAIGATITQVCPLLQTFSTSKIKDYATLFSH